MKRELRPYIATLVEIAGVKVAATLGLMVLFSLTEGIGIALLLPTLQVAGLDLTRQGEAGRYAKLVAGALASLGVPATLPTLLAIFVLLISARALLSSAHSVAAYSTNQAMVLELRRRLYRAITNANWLFLARSRGSDFTHALTAELDRVAMATQQLMMLATESILALLYVMVAFKLSASMTALVLGFGGMLAFALRGRMRAVQESGAAISQATNRLYAAATEHLQSLKTIKTYGAQQRSFAIFSALSENVARTVVGTIRQQAAAGSWFEVGSIVVLGAVIYVSVRVIAVPPAEILILLVLFSRVMPKFMSAHGSYQNFVSALPAFANLMRLEQRCRAAAEPPNSSDDRFELRDAVRLERVSFAYHASGDPVIRAFDVAVPAGQITAIVGPSGAGKSTVADLVMGLIRPDSGRVTVDGMVLEPARARAWRQQLGYVGEDSWLFHDTLRANLLWARPGASEAEMLSALRLAAAEELVRGLSGGIETVVGDRGILLSQGERQRLALARALLRRPAMLVLDEATNSLDSENEARVLGAIRRLRGTLTTLLIAHRLSTIRWADLIYVVEDGRVVESGDWQTLNARRDGRFRALCEAQSLTA